MRLNNRLRFFNCYNISINHRLVIFANYRSWIADYSYLNRIFWIFFGVFELIISDPITVKKYLDFMTNQLTIGWQSWIRLNFKKNRDIYICRNCSSYNLSFQYFDWVNIIQSLLSSFHSWLTRIIWKTCFIIWFIHWLIHSLYEKIYKSKNNSNS